ncbi:alpha/beta hydrolase [Actinomadura verrucosospora]|uniref:TAP domain-containing protein n=1 Tax=Actinomadura verrucosospora TaxID=46165 RepID=A0A7D3VW50_ACTVE|nr:alpha/beta hydrolase [Actinomadura verrucosospora]QKG24299.1 TAP domain-containing protein [Actinomadura verrucosospora]
MLAGAAVPLSSPSVNAAPAAARSPAVDWKACGDDGKAQCATLRLPVDWAHPDGPTFGLAIARRKALDPGARIGTLVFGPGGPGDSGVQRVTKVEGGIDRFSDRLRQRFDIVSFDPRGIGASNPVTCSAAVLAARPDPIIKSRREFDATVAYNEKLRDDCRKRTGPLYDHADTMSTVRDVDAIRAALGETKLSFHGSSYGTLLGEEYAETYPGRVRALVLESVDDHSIRSAQPFLESEMAAAQDSFDRFAAWCDRTASCALHGRDVRAVLRDLRERAARGELADPQTPGRALTEFELLVVTYKTFYGPDWAKLASLLSALEATKPVHPAQAAPATAAPAEGTGTDNFTAQFCSDWNLPVRDYNEFARISRRTERIAPDMHGTRPLMAVTTCLGWPKPVANPQHRLKVRTAAPILLANAVHDPATPYAWARSVARQIGPKATLVTYAGSGHGSYGRGPCMQDAIDGYLISLKVPARGTVCPAVPQ